MPYKKVQGADTPHHVPGLPSNPPDSPAKTTALHAIEKLTLPPEDRHILIGLCAGKSFAQVASENGYKAASTIKKKLTTKNDLRTAYLALMDECGLSDEHLLQTVAAATKANKSVWHKKLDDFVETEDHGVRLAAAKTALELKNAFPDKSETKVAAFVVHSPLFEAAQDGFTPAHTIDVTEETPEEKVVFGGHKYSGSLSKRTIPWNDIDE